jgi:hypothetical protein
MEGDKQNVLHCRNRHFLVGPYSVEASGNPPDVICSGLLLRDLSRRLHFFSPDRGPVPVRADRRNKK